MKPQENSIKILHFPPVFSSHHLIRHVRWTWRRRAFWQTMDLWRCLATHNGSRGVPTSVGLVYWEIYIYYMYICIHIHVLTFTYLFMISNIFINIDFCIYSCVYLFIHLFLLIYHNIYIYIYVYMHWKMRGFCPFCWLKLVGILWFFLLRHEDDPCGGHVVVIY